MTSPTHMPEGYRKLLEKLKAEGQLDEDPLPKGRPCLNGDPRLNDERPWLIPSPPAHVQIMEKPKMNHDYAHCLDLRKSCPKSCFRAQLTREVEERDDLKGIPLTWTHFKGTDECKRKKKNGAD